MSPGRIGSPHEDRVDTDALELLELLARSEARLGDHGLARGDLGEQLVGAVEVDREVGEVSVVDAHDVGVDVERALELRVVVDLDEDVEVERPRLAVELEEVVGMQRRDDEQDGVGAGRRDS